MTFAAAQHADPAQVVFAARGLRFGAGGHQHHVSFGLAPGRTLQVLGPSGCGKTTLLRVLGRLAAAEGGALQLSGRPATAIGPRQWRRQVAYCAQRPVMLSGTVGENLAAAFSPRCIEGRIDPGEARRLLGALGLPVDDAFFAREARVLSGGEAARVALCRALLTRPTVLLADEPAAALGHEQAGEMIGLLRQWVGQGGALIFVAHQHGAWDELADLRLDLGAAATEKEAR